MCLCWGTTPPPQTIDEKSGHVTGYDDKEDNFVEPNAENGWNQSLLRSNKNIKRQSLYYTIDYERHQIWLKEACPKGEGRAVIYKPVQLPVDLIEDLKLYKDAYGMLLAEEEDECGNPIPVHVSYEQMFRRWMDNVKKFDKDVQKEDDAYRSIRATRPDPVYYPVDPCEGDIWEMEYFAWRNGINYPLTVDKELAFYAIIDGEKIGAEQLINEEYELQNDTGVVFDLKDAYRVSKKILRHMNKA